jgi:hypothetical protein
VNPINRNNGGNGQNGSRPQAQAIRIKKQTNKSYGDAAAGLRRAFNEFRTAEQEAFKHGAHFLEAMVDPDALDPQRVPDDLVSASAVFKTRTIFSLPYSGKWDSAGGTTLPLAVPPASGDSTVIAVPGTTETYFTTHGVDVVSLGEQGDRSLVPTLVSSAADSSPWIGHPLFYKTGSVAIIPRQDSTGRFVYEISGDDSKGGDANLSVSLNQIGDDQAIVNAQFELSWSGEAPGVPRTWTPIATPWLGGEEAFNVTVPAFTALSFRVIDADESINWSLSLGVISAIQSPANLSRLLSGAGSCQCFDVRTPTDLDTLQKTYQERPCALSVLCSYAGTTFANGGLITAARLPMSMTLQDAPNGDYFKYISSFPSYADDYPLKDGIYTWWCPDSQTEFFYQDYRSPRSRHIDNTSMLVVNMSRDDPEQEVRTSIVTMIEALTRSNVYAAHVGPTNPLFNKVLEFGKRIPAVAHNPDHKTVLSRAFNKLKTFVLKPDNWVKFAKGAADIFRD